MKTQILSTRDHMTTFAEMKAVSVPEWPICPYCGSENIGSKGSKIDRFGKVVKQFICKNKNCKRKFGENSKGERELVDSRIRALGALVYARTKMDYREVAKFFDVTPEAVRKWVIKYLIKIQKDDNGIDIIFGNDEIEEFVKKYTSYKGSGDEWFMLTSLISERWLMITLLNRFNLFGDEAEFLKEHSDGASARNKEVDPYDYILKKFKNPESILGEHIRNFYSKSNLSIGAKIEPAKRELLDLAIGFEIKTEKKVYKSSLFATQLRKTKIPAISDLLKRTLKKHDQNSDWLALFPEPVGDLEVILIIKDLKEKE